jgi:4-amino-4-deoxy-L-arabinose transferase-like glycosyltransferase
MAKTVVFGAGLVALFFWLGTLDSNVGFYMDDHLYYLPAQAIAEGRGYRVLSVPGEPFQDRHPPAYPLLLSAIYRLEPQFPAHVVPMKAVSAFSVVASLVLWFFVLRRVVDPWLAAFASLLSLSSVLAADVARAVLSDGPFALVAVVGLLLLGTDVEQPERSRWKPFALGVLCGVAYLTRVIAVVLVFVALLEFVKRRSLRAAVMFLVPLAALVLPWLLYRRSVGMGGAVGYENALAAFMPGTGVRGYIIEQFYEARDILFDLLPGLLVSPLYNSTRLQARLAGVGMGMLGPVIAGGVLLLMGMGVASTWKRVTPFLRTYLLLMVAVVWLWPFQFEARFFLPVLPLLCLWIVAGVASAVRFAPRPLAITAAVAAAAACLSFATTVRRFVDVRRSGFDRNNAVLQDFREVSAWLRQHSRERDLVISDNPDATYIWTGLKGIDLYSDRASLTGRNVAAPTHLEPLPAQDVRHARFVVSRSWWPSLAPEEIARMKGVPGRPVAAFGPFRIYDLGSS